ncbi:MAG: glycosyltransferase [Chloroflexota bacterium]
MVTSGLNVGGSELQFVQLALGLRARDWDVAVVSLKRGGPYAGTLVDAGIAVEWCPVGKIASPVSLVGMLTMLRRINPSIVHTQAFRANLWARPCAQLLARPVVASVRATYSYLPRSYRGVERMLTTRTFAVVTPSRATSSYLVDVIGVPAGKVVTIPNGVDVVSLQSSELLDMRARWGVGDAPVVLHTGRLCPQKNPRGMLSAFTLVAREDARPVLVFAGTGPLEAVLRQEAAALGRRVIFAGELNRRELASAMVTSTVCCLMSEFEGMPNALLEAMAVGKPVVATAVDGTAELVSHGQEGILIGRGDAVGMAQAVRRLLGDPGLRKALGSEGRRTAVGRFSVTANIEHHIAVYERALAATHSPRRS